MREHKPSPFYPPARWLVGKIYGKMAVVGAENLPDGEAVIVGNHTQIHGPIACELYFPGSHYTWCAGQMMRFKEVPGYAYQDFWSQKPLSTRWLYKIAAYLIAPLAVFIFNNANTIPVYHDARLLTTFRTTLQRLQEGARVVIFPEQDKKYNHILYEFQDRFVDVARLYYHQTKKEISFVPLYIAPSLKKMVIGAPVRFDPAAPIEAERARICDAMKAEITALAESLPRHRVVPYRNIRKKDYPYNIPDEVTLP